MMKHAGQTKRPSGLALDDIDKMNVVNEAPARASLQKHYAGKHQTASCTCMPRRGVLLADV